MTTEQLIKINVLRDVEINMHKRSISSSSFIKMKEILQTLEEDYKK